MRSSKKKQSPDRSSRKKKGGGRSPKDTVAGGPPPQLETGLPPKDSIIGEKTLKSPKGNVYRILITDQVDGYEEPVHKPVRPKTKSRRKP